MKKVLPFLFLLFIAARAFPQNTEKPMECHYHQIPFTDFCRQVSQKTGVRIFFKEKWCSNLLVSLDTNNITPEHALQFILKNSGLEVSKWNGNLVILPHEKLIEKLPSFLLKAHETIAGKNDQSITVTEKRYLEGRKPDIIQTIRVGKPTGSVNNKNVKVLGRVLDFETGEPVPYATLYIEQTKTGAVSGNDGFFTILLKPGNYTALFNFLGYEHKKYRLKIFSSGDFTIRLLKSVFQIDEFVVHGDRAMSVIRKDPGLDKINVRSIKEMPMMMGERDILKVSGTLPGIVSSGEGSSGLNVRGGSSDENAFYINKIPIYNTAHLFGFFPAFNADIIKDFSVYKGYIPARYGGRLSSVFNIVTRQGNRKKFTAHGGLSPISGNLVVEGPLKKDTCSILLSARSTYSDWILKKIKDPNIRASAANFYDFAAGLNYDIQKTQLSLFFYHSKDHFRLSDISNYSYSNSGISLDFSHNYTKSLRGVFSLIGSQYDFSTINRQELSKAYTHAYKMEHYETRADFTQTLSNTNSINYGADFILYKLDRGNVLPEGVQSLQKKVALGKEQAIESALYLSDSYNPKPWLSFTAGGRFTMFTALGPTKVYTYSSGLPMDLRYVNDSILFGNRQPVRWYPEPDIRAAATIKTDENGTVKLAFNQMHQNLFMLSNTLSVAPNTQWKLSDYHLLPSKSNQLSLGVFRTFSKSGIDASVEVYYKRSYNNPEFKDGASFINNPHVETAVLQGKQKAYGVEFFIKRSNRKLEGWFTYTYSRAIVQIKGNQPWNSINHGLPYPSNFDLPHVANLVLNYHLSRRITFSTIVTYKTGKPVTYPVSVYYIDGKPFLDYSNRNAYRVPDYFRTDLSLAVEGNLRKKKLMHSSLVFSIYNLTGRQNPYSVYFNTENGKIKSYQYSVIGVPIFTITWNFKLGNYASN